MKVIILNEEEEEALLNAIACSHLPDKVHLQGVLKQLKQEYPNEICVKYCPHFPNSEFASANNRGSEG